VDAAAPVVGILQAGELAGEVHHFFGAVVGIFDLLKGSEAPADFDDEEAAEGFEGIGGAVVLFEFGVLFAEAIVPLEAFDVLEPVVVAGAAPVGDVLVGDGAAGEMFVHGGFGFREAVEPFFDGAELLAVF
jgi:hypothetical protein